MRDCEKVRDDLKAYLDGQLLPAPRLAVRLHLTRCASCRQEIKAMEQIGKELRAGDVGALEPALREKILAGIPLEMPEKPGNDRPRWRRPVIVWGAAATAVLVWFVFYPLVAPGRRVAYESSVSSAPSRAAGSPSSALAGSMAMYRQDYDADIKNSKSRMVVAQHSAPAGSTVVDAPVNQQIPSAAPRVAPNGIRGVDAGRPSSVVTLAPTDGKTADTRHAPTELAAKSIHRGSSFKMPSKPEADLPAERQVHREATITVAVANVEQQSEAVERIVKESGGFVANNELSTGEDNLKSASLTVKVPVEQFDTILSQLTKLGDVKAKNVIGEDITEKVSDEEQTSHILRDDIVTTEAKLRQKRSRPQSMRDEETLRHLRTRIAQSQARLQMLKRLSALATINVELQQKSKTPPPATPKTTGGLLEDMGDTAHAAAHSFLMALRLPVQLLVWIVVYAPIWMLLAIAYRRAIRA
jgi:anti-sigma factor RsiW